MKKIVNIVFSVITYLFLLVAIVLLIFSIIAKKESDDAINIFNHQIRVVVSNSMAKSNSVDVSDYKIKDIKVKSMVLIETVPKDLAKKREWYSNLKIGDVLTFKYVYVRQETITHRIVNIENKDDGYLITLEGDNKTDNTTTSKQIIDTTDDDSPNYIIGKVIYKNYLMGIILYILKQPIGLALIIIVPCLIIIIWQMIKIISTIYGAKKTKQEEKIASLEEKLKLLEEKQKGKEDKNA